MNSFDDSVLDSNRSAVRELNFAEVSFEGHLLAGLRYRFGSENSALHPTHLICTILLEPDFDLELSTHWMSLSRHFYLKQLNGNLLRAHRISASATLEQGRLAQTLVFETEGVIPQAIGCDHQAFKTEVVLDTSLQACLGDLFDAR